MDSSIEMLVEKILRGRAITIHEAGPLLTAAGLNNISFSSWDSFLDQLGSKLAIPSNLPLLQAQLGLLFQAADKVDVPLEVKEKVVCLRQIVLPLWKCILEQETAHKETVSKYTALKRENEMLLQELEGLQNSRVDQDYENGFFIENEVLKNVEAENIRLRELTEVVYSDIARVWFNLVEDKIKENGRIED